MTRAIPLILILFGALQAQKSLNGIRCDLNPATRVDNFVMPVLPANGKSWQITNNFGNRVTNKDIPGLPNGVWQHTGVDYLLGGSSNATQNQPIYSSANGVVIFSSKSNTNPVPARGGLVIIRHLAPEGAKIRAAKYRGNAGAYDEFDSQDFYTYYLHLDQDNVRVSVGDDVQKGQQIGQTYSARSVGKLYSYVPHLHFEIWSVCSSTELNGYEIDGSLSRALRNPVIDPISFLTNVSIIGGIQPKTNDFDLSGIWIANGYSGGKPIRVSIRQTGNEVVVIKLSATQYVPAGEVTWFGEFTSNPFDGKMRIARKDFQDAKWQDISVKVQDEKHLVVTLLTRNTTSKDLVVGSIRFTKVE